MDFGPVMVAVQCFCHVGLSRPGLGIWAFSGKKTASRARISAENVKFSSLLYNFARPYNKIKKTELIKLV